LFCFNYFSHVTIFVYWLLYFVGRGKLIPSVWRRAFIHCASASCWCSYCKLCKVVLWKQMFCSWRSCDCVTLLRSIILSHAICVVMRWLNYAHCTLHNYLTYGSTFWKLKTT